MEQHIKKQLKDIRRQLCKQFEKTPLMGDMTFHLDRLGSMNCEGFDILVTKMWNQYEEELTDERSCWSGVMDFTLGIQIDHKSGDSNGMPMIWKLSVCWGMDGFQNPFEEEEEEEEEDEKEENEEEEEEEEEENEEEE
jgi:hypothetical protein